ncbi:MAG: hypothetical protein V5A55_05565 [Halovenus sp.]
MEVYAAVRDLGDVNADSGLDLRPAVVPRACKRWLFGAKSLV